MAEHSDMNMSSWWKKGIGILAIVAIAGGVIGGTVMLLWNWLVPPVFGLETITFWQALGLFVLSKILFGFGGKGGKMRCKSDKYDLFRSMSPEEREEFKTRMKERFCRPEPKTGDQETKQPN